MPPEDTPPKDSPLDSGDRASGNRASENRASENPSSASSGRRQPPGVGSGPANYTNYEVEESGSSAALSQGDATKDSTGASASGSGRSAQPPSGLNSGGDRPSRSTPLGLKRSDRVRFGSPAARSSASSSGVTSRNDGAAASGSRGNRSAGPADSAVAGNTASGGGGTVPSGAGSGRVGSGISRGTARGQSDFNQLVRQSLKDLERQRTDLQREVEQLERRKERLEAEMRSSFAGSSQDIAIRVQGFKDYLVGSLQDLVAAAEQMQLTPATPLPEPSAPTPQAQPEPESAGGMVPLASQKFAQQRDRINSLLDQYRMRPDYYGPPWQLRRTFEPVHADRTANWFFTQGGRGAVKTLGSRLQNVLVASAAISCLYAIYDRRLCVLVLATTPERLGEWRRWLQDSLGIARSDFGTNRGVMLFESAEPMAQRAERLLNSGRVPFLITDEAEDKVSLSLLQFPLLLGFAPDPANPSSDYDYY